MVNTLPNSKANKKLLRELDAAERFAREAIDEQFGAVPATLLVVFKQRHQYPPRAYSLYDPDNLEISIRVDIRTNLRAAAAEIARQKEVSPVYALSMIEIPESEQDFWLKKGFFPPDQLPDTFIGQDTLLITASDSSGRVLRRLVHLVDSPLLLNSSCRQLGRCVQVEQSEQPTEMAAFWQQYERSS